MQSLDLIVIQQAREWIQKEPVCTVLSTYGSSPRSPGALLARQRTDVTDSGDHAVEYGIYRKSH